MDLSRIQRTENVRLVTSGTPITPMMEFTGTVDMPEDGFYKLDKSMGIPYDKMFDITIGEINNHVVKNYTQIEKDIEYILRNKIDKPIKGEITKGKLRWRGIRSIAYYGTYDKIYVGIIQRDKLINSDGFVLNITK